jgi:hypothetical protein
VRVEVEAFLMLVSLCLWFMSVVYVYGLWFWFVFMVVLIDDWCFELSLFCYSNICFFLLCFFASSLPHFFASSLPPSTFVANAGLSGKRLVQEVKSVLADVKLTFAADKQCGKYSGGMKRRLSVANALVGNPQIVSVNVVYMW